MADLINDYGFGFEKIEQEKKERQKQELIEKINLQFEESLRKLSLEISEEQRKQICDHLKKEITKTITERITKEPKLKDTKEKINLNF